MVLVTARYDDDPPTLTLGAAISILPWILIGIVVLVGASTIAVYGLPFESKTNADQTAQQLSQTVTLLNKTVDQVNSLAMNQAVMQEALKNIANQTVQIDELRKTVEQQAIHIEGLEADQKADDSRRAARQARGQEP